jgi:hypothetical protein
LTTTQLFAPAALAGAAAPATNGGVVVAVDPLGAAFEASAPPMSAIAMIATAIAQPTPKVALNALANTVLFIYRRALCSAPLLA